MDFTLRTYRSLLNAFLEKGYHFQTFAGFLEEPKNKSVILRNDVDKAPGNSLRFALIQSSLGIKATFYFRIVRKSFNPDILKKIASLGHEIGYHYEDLALAKGDPVKAISLFNTHLAKLREYYPIKTICMHGSPLSKWDNRILWKTSNYLDYGITGEPYFDVDYIKVLYLTDTGRRWDGGGVSIRDKIPAGNSPAASPFHTTQQIIRTLESGVFPDQVMLTFHPQRWHANAFRWTSELVLQNTKNIAKFGIVKILNRTQR